MQSNTSNFYNKLLPVDYVLKNFKEIKLEKKYSDKLKDGKIVYLSNYNKEESNNMFLIKCISIF